uniref:Uncharacterized protein n=1 Tax=Oryza punctata TaxID=4537 RepID=A0A0E0LSZ5_ORYPU
MASPSAIAPEPPPYATGRRSPTAGNARARKGAVRSAAGGAAGRLARRRGVLTVEPSQPGDLFERPQGAVLFENIIYDYEVSGNPTDLLNMNQTH